MNLHVYKSKQCWQRFCNICTSQKVNTNFWNKILLLICVCLCSLNRTLWHHLIEKENTSTQGILKARWVMMSQARGVVCLGQSPDSKFQWYLVLQGSKGLSCWKEVISAMLHVLVGSPAWLNGLRCWIWNMEVPGSNPPPYFYLDLFSLVNSLTML